MLLNPLIFYSWHLYLIFFNEFSICFLCDSMLATLLKNILKGSFVDMQAPSSRFERFCFVIENEIDSLWYIRTYTTSIYKCTYICRYVLMHIHLYIYSSIHTYIVRGIFTIFLAAKSECDFYTLNCFSLHPLGGWRCRRKVKQTTKQQH